jgi:hypothetical protein
MQHCLADITEWRTFSLSGDLPVSANMQLGKAIWPAVSRPVYPGVRPPFETRNQFLFLCHGNYLQIFAFLLVWVPSLTRGCLKCTRTSATVPCQWCHSRVQVQQNLRPYLTVSFETRFPFCLFLRLAVLRWSILTPLRMGLQGQKSRSELSYDRRSVGQSILVSGHHLAPATNFPFSSAEIIYRHLRFFLVWGALSDEKMSKMYSYKCYRPLPVMTL